MNNGKKQVGIEYTIRTEVIDKGREQCTIQSINDIANQAVNHYLVALDLAITAAMPDDLLIHNFKKLRTEMNRRGLL